MRLSRSTMTAKGMILPVPARVVGIYWSAPSASIQRLELEPELELERRA